MTQVVLFWGLDADDDAGLWETNGTLSGTFEIGGVADAGVNDSPPGKGGGLDPQDLTTFGDEVLFEGYDSGSGIGLWITNGTAAGTYEIGGIDDAGVAGAGLQGIAPGDFVPIGSKVLFVGVGYNSTVTESGLWVTDGTTSGTMELGGSNSDNIVGKNPYDPFIPNYITSIGTKAVFTEIDAVYDTCLWVSNGTTAGTFEIGGYRNAGVSGAGAQGLDPTTIVAFGNKAIFGADDSTGDYGLWITDGTVAGTTEIGGLSNSALTGDTTGLGDALNQSVVADGILYFGNTVTYWGYLWESNGTSAGTFEIGGTHNAGITEVDAVAGLQPENFVAMGTEAIFDGKDTTGNYGLWVTNGTAAGTVEIGGVNNAGVTGAYAHGLQIWVGVNIQYSVTFGNEVLFTADDANQAAGLWITNGTAAGTIELGGLSDAGISGAAATGLRAQDFVVDGNEVIFGGWNSLGEYALWETNGTAAGTVQINDPVGVWPDYGLDPLDLTPLTTTVAIAPTITGTKAGQKTTSEAAVKPFAGVTIADPNSGATDKLTITVGGAGGTLSGSGLSGGTSGIYTLAGTAAAVTSELDALSFKPKAGKPNTTSTSTFTLSDKSSAYATATVNSTTTVIDTDPAVAPTITGTKAGQKTTSEAAVKPFSGVTIADANSGATDKLTITVGGAGGTLTGTGLSGGTSGVYTLAGTAAAVTSELDALSFKPKAGKPNTKSTSTFTLSDKSSAYATATVNSTTTVIDTDPAVAPTITGTKAGQKTTSEAAVKPFSGVTIADPNSGATDKLTITVGGAGGTLTGKGLSGGTSGVYTLAGTAAAVTSELDALSFKPKAGKPNTTSTSTFTLSDKSSAYATATVNSTTTVIDTDPAAAASIQLLVQSMAAFQSTNSNAIDLTANPIPEVQHPPVIATPFH